MNTMFSPVVVCRPALPSDAPDVLEFTKHIWEGHDYIREVWSDWLADPEGLLMVAEYAGHAVGLGKITLLAAGQWWLEGLRVDPNHQGLKIGTHIWEYLEDWWKKNGGGDIRLMTSSERVQVHHLSGRFGYEKLGEVRSFTASADPAAGDRFEPVDTRDVARALDFARAHLGIFNGLMDWGWRFSVPDEPSLRGLVERRAAWWWTPSGAGSDPRGLLAFWSDEEEGERQLGISFAAVQQPDLPSFLGDCRRLAHRLDFVRLVWLSPVITWVEAALKQAGFETDWDGTGFLYGKRARAPAPPGD